MDPKGDIVPILNALAALFFAGFIFLIALRADLRRDFIGMVKNYFH